MHHYGDEVAAIARPLRDAGDLDILVDRAAGARVVMVGEASHGTHEFYVWRDALTRRLIEELGFSFVAVEGDWPDCERVGASVTCARGDPRSALHAYDRWPTWMWANEEVVDFACWLARFNTRNQAGATGAEAEPAAGGGHRGAGLGARGGPAQLGEKQRSRGEKQRSRGETAAKAGARPGPHIGFHGLDVYSLWESLRLVLTWLRDRDPALIDVAMQAYHCLEAYGEDPNAYAYATRIHGASCEDKAVRLLLDLRGRDLAVWQNAEVVAGAEHYYRAMMDGGTRSWNVRDRHMDATLARLLDHYGPESKGVVWAHNTHVGDAQATDQAKFGEVTIGSLARQRFGHDQVLLIGLGSHHGTVVAGRQWGAPMEVMGVPPARPGSIEDILHAEAPQNALFVVPELGQRPDLLVDELAHRAIGVVYRPEREAWGNYVPSVLGDRYDAFLWFDETHALRPLHTHHVDVHEPETYPSGV
jgi:erythromycin esterase-like protein